MAERLLVFCCILLFSWPVWLTGCQSLRVNSLRDRMQPSNFRNWTAELAVLPYAELDGDQITVYNIRDSQYLTENDFILNYYDRTFAVEDIQTVDFIVVPFQGMEFVAHTMLSFGLANGEYICVSAEIRTEKEEEYSAVMGIANQFELIYVVASERDLIRLRTHYRDADVYVYPTVATPRQAQALFVDVMQRVNQLAEQPEFYHTLVNNCTTNILDHLKRLPTEDSLADNLRYNWQILLPGFSDRYAYDRGLIRTHLSFNQTRQLAQVNDLADQYYHDPDFSRKIRRRHTAMLETDTDFR